MRNINPKNIVELIQLEFADYTSSEASHQDRRLASEICELIRTSMSSGGITIESLSSLDVDEETYDDNSLEGDVIPSVKITLTEDQLKQALDFYRSSRTGTRTTASMMNRFRFIKSNAQIHQILAYILTITCNANFNYDFQLDTRNAWAPVYLKFTEVSTSMFISNSLRSVAYEFHCTIET
jgi:hypothetical protein